MRRQSTGVIASFAALTFVLACKDSTPSGPQSFDTQSPSLGEPGFTKLPPGCKRAHGRVELTLIPSANDPLGRSIGPSSGTLKGAVSSLITSFVPGGGGVINATTTDVLVAGPTDIVVSNATTVYTPIPTAPAGTFSVATTQTIVSGTGKYAGATGTLQVTGTGYDLFGGVGNTYFDLEYEGQICT